ncbi:hypothetical protein [Wenxinia marina]|uniref:Uncharacterized protein n=1 Tax=Wenxinia marina DSM 24838 TaxID=1123501 RepID=A0A0D0NNX1_9RHOB|nr:hypothetical protein [Wenxinia marina]KIQ69985.1 hypothetical protein Wenmar_01555 [Wenxinia marina DSM 24838]GGL62676.1 hypothetical protein GCM10011392_16600 [Wenxinia marina]
MRALAVALALLSEAALAEGGLEGRTVVFRVESYDDPAAPYLVSEDYVGAVGPGPEFSMEEEGGLWVDVVPVRIDLSDGEIELTWPSVEAGPFATFAFNGYVMEFAGDCALIERAKVVDWETTLPLADDALEVTPLRLALDVSGLEYGPDQRIVIALQVADCPVS